MRSLFFVGLLFLGGMVHSQRSDFANIDFTKADNAAARLQKKKLKINELTYELTKNLETDVEKFRAIFMWVTHNISNDQRLFLKNNKKRKKYFGDSIALEKWNSKFKKIVFKKLLKKKKTLCSGYAYLLQEMCDVVGIRVKTIHGFGKTSDVDLDKLLFANHSWSAVRLNQRWYLCDPTWAAGIIKPENKRFQFKYNDGYFLTGPTLFVMNHYPIETQWTLLGNDTPSFEEFSQGPLLYGPAFEYLNAHLAPKKMHHNISKSDQITFQYELQDQVNLNSIELVFVKGYTEFSRKPKISRKGNDLQLSHTFNNRGFYDVHLYFNQEIIATYTFQIGK